MEKERQEQYFTELARCLARAGFSVQPPQDDHLPVEWRGQSLCRVNARGTVFYQQSDVADCNAEQALRQVTDVTRTTTEYMERMEQAPDLSAAGLDSGYKLLGEFNDVVLAGKQTRFGVNFITWDRDRAHTGLSRGHYFMEDYAGAKRDFAVRSGLVPRERIFTPEQLTEIYRSIHETLESGYPITDARQKLLESAAEQIEDGVPDLAQRVCTSNLKEMKAGGEVYEQTLVM